jgi:hypothetical protein
MKYVSLYSEELKLISQNRKFVELPSHGSGHYLIETESLAVKLNL